MIDAISVDEDARPGAPPGPVFDLMERLCSLHVFNKRTDVLDEEVLRLVSNAERRRDLKRPLGPSNRRDARIVIVSGESGAGKSAAVERVLSTLPGFDDPESECPVVRVSAPSPCTLTSLGCEISKALGYPILGHIEENRVWRRVRNDLELKRISVVAIDELQHLTEHANVIERTKVQNTLKHLLINPSWPVGLLLSGVPSVENLFWQERQLRNRRRVVRLPQLQPGPDDLEVMADIVLQFAELAGLSLEADARETLVLPLMKMADWSFGTTIEFALAVIEVALKAGDATVRLSHLEKVRGLQVVDPVPPSRPVETDASDAPDRSARGRAAKTASKARPKALRRGF